MLISCIGGPGVERGGSMNRILQRGWTCSIPVVATIVAIVSPSVSYAQSDALERSSVIPITAATDQTRGERLTVDTLEEGSSNWRIRRSAIEEIPLARLNPEGRREVEEILDGLSLFRRLPTIQLEADPRVYEFFTRHPDVAVSIWRAMNISRVQLWQTGPNEYETDTRDGTWGEVQVLLRSPTNYIVTCRGEFKSPALPKAIRADAMMHLKPEFKPDGTIVHQVDLFVSFPSQTVETIAKIVSPLSNRIADRNFEEISLFLVMMNVGMSRQPGWVEQISQRLEGILDGRADALLAVTASVYVDAETKRRRAQGLPVSADAIQPPVSAVPMSQSAIRPVVTPTSKEQSAYRNAGASVE